MGFLEGGVTAFTGRQLLSKEWLDMTAFSCSPQSHGLALWAPAQVHLSSLTQSAVCCQVP